MSSSPPCLSSVRFGSFLAYSPRGESAASVKSRAIAYAIKNVRPGFISAVVVRLREEMLATRRAAVLTEVLGRDVLVVPCPKSAPLMKDALWPPKEATGQGPSNTSSP